MLLGLALGLVGALALYPVMISLLTRHGLGQRVQAYNPASHAAKVGTPTMGGLLFCALMLLGYLLLDRSRDGFVLIFALLAGAAVGCLDDVDNIRGHAALGMGVRQKLGLQLVIGVLVGIGLNVVGAGRELVPFVGTRNLGVGIIPVAAIAVVACTNAVNLTDGVDGLAGSCTAIALAALLAIALHVHAVPAVVICAVGVGSLAGFVVFNWHPARIFMGDTGALSLGACLVALCCELGMLWLLPLLGLVFVVETLSVIVNVTAIRRFHHRVLRASPLHGHFEEAGVGEARLVLAFSLVAALCALATLLFGLGIIA